MKHTVKIVFGSAGSSIADQMMSAYEEGGEAQCLKLEEEYCEEIQIFEKEFDTEAEVNAYLEGVSDGEGWMGWYHLEPKEAEIIEKVIEYREKQRA